MKKKYIIICSFLFVLASLYISKDVYYINRWHMFVKIEYSNDTATIYLSNSWWHWGDNYIKYRPQSAEITNLDLNPIKDTLYVIEHYMKIIETHVKDYNVKEVQYIRNYAQRDYWTDSTFIKEKPHDWIRINHRHGLSKSWE